MINNSYLALKHRRYGGLATETYARTQVLPLGPKETE
jgi:hypothetical protein